jgi:hypothetical protein
VADQIDPAWWGSFKDCVRIIQRDTFSTKFVDDGWISQQVLKILGSAVSFNEWAMVLDAKTLFVQSFLGTKPLNEFDATQIQNTKYGYFYCNLYNTGTAYSAAIDGLNNFLKNIKPANIRASDILRDILLAMMDLTSSSNKFIKHNIGTNGTINLDYSSLQDNCEKLLGLIKNNLLKLRPLFAMDNMNSGENSLDRFENVKFIGSTRWLEEHLIDILFKDRDECGLPRAHADHLQTTLRRFTKKAMIPLIILIFRIRRRLLDLWIIVCENYCFMAQIMMLS